MLKQIPDLVRGGVLDKVIPSFDYLVYLFMIISGFGMCNGYYQKLKTGTYSIDAFYSKRYKRTVPFFALLILLNCVIEFTPKTVCEGLMEITMLFGFLPNNTLSTIVVAWTLGAIFAFYIIFPFIHFLCPTSAVVFGAPCAPQGRNALFGTIFINQETSGSNPK